MSYLLPGSSDSYYFNRWGGPHGPSMHGIDGKQTSLLEQIAAIASYDSRSTCDCTHQHACPTLCLRIGALFLRRGIVSA
jgi:hypothetical protein